MTTGAEVKGNMVNIDEQVEKQKKGAISHQAAFPMKSGIIYFRPPSDFPGEILRLPRCTANVECATNAIGHVFSFSTATSTNWQARGTMVRDLPLHTYPL